MKKLYIECNMGIAGDMLLAALYDLLDDKDGFVEELSRMGLENVEYRFSSRMSMGLKGSVAKVLVGGMEEESRDISAYHHAEEHHPHDEHYHEEYRPHDEHYHYGEHHHHHDGYHHHGNSHEDGHGYAENHHHADGEHHTHSHDGKSFVEIRDRISRLQLPDKVKEDAIAIYHIIAEAESMVHDTSVDCIHFHELGDLDAIADICAVALAIYRLGAVTIGVGPVNTGSGLVKIAHGIVPVPAPATALILEGIPSYASDIKAELCTPTGAAIIKHFAAFFGNRPLGTIEKIAYGLGKKEFACLNAVRVYVLSEACGISDMEKDAVYEIHTNIDDMTAETLGFAMKKLLEEAALDVYFIPIYMKKNRPAYLFSCICKEEDLERCSALILEHTTSIGLRYRRLERYKLRREERVLDTIYGKIRVKAVHVNNGIRMKPEFEDMEAAANQSKQSIGEIYKEIMRMY